MQLRSIWLIASVGLGIFLAPLASEAQQRGNPPRVGFLRRSSPIPAELDAFRQGLSKLGYFEGQNIFIEQRYAEGALERLPALAAELVTLKVDAIVVDGPLTVRAAKAATNTIPIVFAIGGDPVQLGLVSSLARPGGTVTGLATLSTELSGKRLQLIKEAVASLSRLAVLGNPENPSIKPSLEEMRTSARLLGVQLQVLEARSPSEWGSAFSAMAKGRARALYVLGDATFSSHRERLVELTFKGRLPAMFTEREFVEAGGLISYAPNIPDNFRRAAAYVDKILKGTKPADLPVEQPMRFELVINLKTAKALGLTIPQSVLFRADQVIQ